MRGFMGIYIYINIYIHITPDFNTYGSLFGSPCNNHHSTCGSLAGVPVPGSPHINEMGEGFNLPWPLEITAVKGLPVTPITYSFILSKAIQT